MEDIYDELKTQGQKAIVALQQYYNQLNKKVLFSDHNTVHLTVRYKKAALQKGKISKKYINLPFSDRNPINTSVCLILPDFDQSDEAKIDPDVDRQSREWVDILTNKYSISKTDYANVITFNQLKREYSQPADRTRLSNTYDIFLVDTKLLLKAYSFLGKEFRKNDKTPLPIDSSSPKNFAKQLKNAYSLIVLPLQAYTDCFAIRIGNLQQNAGELHANLDEIIKNVLENCPGSPLNLRSCYLQAKNNTEYSLPIYVDFGSANDVKIDQLCEPEYCEELGELSTLPEGLSVKVRNDGLVTVVDETTGEEVLYPTEKDESEAKDDIRPMSNKAVARVVKAKAKKLSSLKEGGVRKKNNERNSKD